MKKMIFFMDLDGTLLMDDKTVSKEDYDAVHWALEKGHCIAITTGRPVCSTQRIIDMLDINCDGSYLVAYNGGTLYDCGKKELLFEEVVDLEDVKYLGDEAKKAGLYFQTYSGDYAVTEEDSEEALFYRKKVGIEFIFDKNIWKHVVASPNKAMVIDLNGQERMKQFQEEHMDWFQGRCNSMFSCPQFLEFVPLNASKGNAVHKLAEILGVPMENTVAIGDERNDISMLKEAHYGVCMANGHVEVKAIADIITTRDNNHGGVAEIIYKLG